GAKSQTPPRPTTTGWPGRWHGGARRRVSSWPASRTGKCSQARRSCVGNRNPPVNITPPTAPFYCFLWRSPALIPDGAGPPVVLPVPRFLGRDGDGGGRLPLEQEA